MLRPCTALAAFAAVIALAACAGTGVRYVDASGTTYAGTVDPLTQRVTADIAGRTYRGPLQVNDWGQARSILTAAGADPLYCTFQYRGLKVAGSCTDLAGGEYAMESR